MQGIDELIDEVITIVEWYKCLPKDYSNIEDLMYARQKICGNMFMLSVELGKARQAWKEYEYTTESVRRKTMAEMLVEGNAIGKSDAYARADSMIALEQQQLSESYFYRLKFMFDSSQDVNNTIMQHISVLKKERENTPQYT
jgi:hypothetical protein